MTTDPNKLIEAKLYHSFLVRELDAYRKHLILTKSDKNVLDKCDIVQSYINFRYNFYLDTELDLVVAKKIGKKFGKGFNKENKSNVTDEDLQKTIGDFYDFVVETMN